MTSTNALSTSGPSPPVPPRDDDVRSCERCRAPAVVCVEITQQRYATIFGSVPAGEGARTYCCQSCGHCFELGRRGAGLRSLISGLLLAPMGSLFLCGTFVRALSDGGIGVEVVILAVMSAALIGCGVALLRKGYRTRTLADRNPLVAAPRPEVLRFRPVRPGDANRRCVACGAICRITKLTHFRTNGIPTGAEREFRCTGCNREFVIASPGRGVFMLFAAAVGSALGIASLVHSIKMNAPFFDGGHLFFLIFGVVFGLGSPLIALQIAWRFAEHLRNPVVGSLT
jgi:hypothetical protein